MTRVKMNAKHEYEFVANYKVLQTMFKTKKIDKARLFLYLTFPYTVQGFSPLSSTLHLKWSINTLFCL